MLIDVDVKKYDVRNTKYEAQTDKDDLYRLGSSYFVFRTSYFLTSYLVDFLRKIFGNLKSSRLSLHQFFVSRIKSGASRVTPGHAYQERLREMAL